MFKTFFIFLVCFFCYFLLNAQIIANRVSQCNFNKDYYIVEFFVIEMNDLSEVSSFYDECKKAKKNFIPYYTSGGVLQINGKEMKYRCNLFLIKYGQFSQEEISLEKETQRKIKVCFSGEFLFENDAPVLYYTYTFGDQLLINKGVMTIELDQVTFIGGGITIVSTDKGKQKG